MNENVKTQGEEELPKQAVSPLKGHDTKVKKKQENLTSRKVGKNITWENKILVESVVGADY